MDFLIESWHIFIGILLKVAHKCINGNVINFSGNGLSAFGDRSLSEPMMVKFMYAYYICTTLPR